MLIQKIIAAWILNCCLWTKGPNSMIARMHGRRYSALLGDWEGRDGEAAKIAAKAAGLTQHGTGAPVGSCGMFVLPSLDEVAADLEK